MVECKILVSCTKIKIQIRFPKVNRKSSLKVTHGRICDSNRFTDLANHGKCHVIFIFVRHLGECISYTV